MYRFVNLLFSLSLVLVPVFGAPRELAPSPIRQGADASALLAAMSPAEKVGQLFMVSFYGAQAGEGTDIHRLITEYHVGGVVLSAINDNITDTINAPTQVLSLTNQLQTAAVQASGVGRLGGQAGEPILSPFVPLLVAVNHEGDGHPFTEIQSGVTELPNQMAIGATWDLSQAESMGRIAGTELASMGINMLLGPSLDVLETPRPEGTDLGTRVFGGDPYWVGQMGKAYIRGVHYGSEDSVAVVAKHFPGHGGSDRRPEEEVPTVRKSFEDLRNFDLVPFLEVTGAERTEAVADALLAAHIRFQGFQGNIRQVTPPVSFDVVAFSQLMALPEIQAWRANGGVTVSDSLGVNAVKRFYDPSLQQFNNRRIAREAFNAGNDLLLLTEFGLNPRVDQTQNVIDTLTHFRQQYETDANFAARVDAAVLRILNLKLRLYGGEFDPQLATRPESGLAVLGRDREDVAGLAEQAAALISPTLDELEARAPEPPSSQRIVFFTDVRQGQQCSTCLRYPLLDKRELELAVLQLYGPDGTGQTRSSFLQSYSFEELAAHLDHPNPSAVGDETPTPPPSAVETALQQADWIVFAMLNVTPAVPSSDVISTFLSQHPEIVRTKKVVVFAFNAPYYLDTTDLSKLTAFYALYSHAPAFVTTAARLLFREISPQGDPPISVSSIGYNLIEITKPDPNSIIELNWEKANASGEGTPETGALELGDTITLTTGLILDHNGHPVPDDTPVRFRIYYADPGLPEFLEAGTQDGVASVTLPLNRPGEMVITASSEPATASTTLEVNVQEGSAVEITAIVPTPLPTETPQPTDTPVPPTPTTAPSPTATMEPEPEEPVAVDWRGFFMMCLGLVAVLVSGYRLGTLEETHTRNGIRVALAGAIGMLVGYNYFALGLPGSAAGYDRFGALAAPLFALLTGGLGLVLGWLWFVRRRRLADSRGTTRPGSNGAGAGKSSE